MQNSEETIERWTVGEERWFRNRATLSLGIEVERTSVFLHGIFFDTSACWAQPQHRIHACERALSRLRDLLQKYRSGAPLPFILADGRKTTLRWPGTLDIPAEAKP